MDGRRIFQKIAKTITSERVCINYNRFIFSSSWQPAICMNIIIWCLKIKISYGYCLLFCVFCLFVILYPSIRPHFHELASELIKLSTRWLGQLVKFLKSRKYEYNLHTCWAIVSFLFTYGYLLHKIKTFWNLWFLLADYKSSQYLVENGYNLFPGPAQFYFLST